MSVEHRPPLHDLDENAALRTILEGTATETGQRFFSALVKNLSRALDTHGAWVTEYLEKERRLVLEEIRTREDAPAVVAFEQACEAIFPDHPLGQRAIGTGQRVVVLAPK